MLYAKTLKTIIAVYLAVPMEDDDIVGQGDLWGQGQQQEVLTLLPQLNQQRPPGQGQGPQRML